MRAEPVEGEKLRYYVHSESEENETHVVDLAALNGNGECSCTDFTMRRAPAFNKNGGNVVHFEKDKKGRVVAEATYCKHIAVAKMELATEIGRTINLDNRPKPVTIRDNGGESGFGSLPF